MGLDDLATLIMIALDLLCYVMCRIINLKSCDILKLVQGMVNSTTSRRIPLSLHIHVSVTLNDFQFLNLSFKLTCFKVNFQNRHSCGL